MDDRLCVCLSVCAPLHLTLCDPTGCSPPGSSVPGDFPAPSSLGGFPGGSDGKESACNAGDLGLIPASAHQAPPSQGFSRQEHWSGLPCSPPGDLPNPGIEPRSPALQADPLPSKPQGQPKNTGVGSLSLLPWIFPTQELNRGLLHCRRILYQLSYQGSLKCELDNLYSMTFTAQGD